MSQVKTLKTSNPEQIRKWIESRDGVPVRIAYDSTGKEYSPLGVWFKEESKDVPQSYQVLEWEDFFQLIERDQLALQYEENGDGRYHEFVKE
jgi:hypothetical protein